MGKRRTDGQGSVHQVHVKGCERPIDGRGQPACKCPWRGALVIGYRTGPSGRPVAIRKTVSAKTRSAAANRVDELKEKRAVDELPEGKAVTVEQWMKHWLTTVARKNSANTLTAYSKCAQHYIVPLLGHHRLDRLTADHIEEAWEQLLDDGNPNLPVAVRRPLSANTVHLTHRVLSRSLRVAVQRKRLRANPAGPDSMDAPPRVEDEIEPIPRADVAQILAACEGHPYAARWSVALALGLRPGEALGLRWEDVDLEAGTLTVAQQLQRQTGKGLVVGKPKSKSGARTMYLPPSLLAAMKAHRKAQNEARLRAGDHWTDSGLVFTLDDGRAVDPRLDRRRWCDLLATAGVQHRRLYDARHSAATILLAQGVEIRTAMALLGHSQVSVTMRYQHAVDDIKAAAAQAIEAGFYGTHQG